jgi:hypothetical protein
VSEEETFHDVPSVTYAGISIFDDVRCSLCAFEVIRLLVPWYLCLGTISQYCTAHCHWTMVIACQFDDSGRTAAVRRPVNAYSF